jgi:hypothetical protein
MQKPFWHKKRSKRSPSDEDLDSMIEIIPGCLTFRSHLNSCSVGHHELEIADTSEDLRFDGNYGVQSIGRTLKESNDEASDRDVLYTMSRTSCMNALQCRPIFGRLRRRKPSRTVV